LQFPPLFTKWRAEDNWESFKQEQLQQPRCRSHERAKAKAKAKQSKRIESQGASAPLVPSSNRPQLFHFKSIDQPQLPLSLQYPP